MNAFFGLIAFIIIGLVILSIIFGFTRKIEDAYDEKFGEDKNKENNNLKNLSTIKDFQEYEKNSKEDIKLNYTEWIKRKSEDRENQKKELAKNYANYVLEKSGLNESNSKYEFYKRNLIKSYIANNNSFLEGKKGKWLKPFSDEWNNIKNNEYPNYYKTNYQLYDSRSLNANKSDFSEKRKTYPIRNFLKSVIAIFVFTVLFIIWLLIDHSPSTKINYQSGSSSSGKGWFSRYDCGKNAIFEVFASGGGQWRDPATGKFCRK